MSISVLPHPDDEFQVWSMLEDQPDQYSVIVYLTRGEETGFCEPDIAGTAYQPGLEAPATPEPEGRWSDSCERARIASALAFFSDMADRDSTVPGDFAEPIVAGPFDDPRNVVCRVDDGEECNSSNRSASVWADRDGRGAVVFFDLGDGDLSAEEAVWAISVVLHQRAALGLESTPPVAGLVGGFANDSSHCFSYPHPDHLAVHEALFSFDFGLGFQMAATCASGRDVKVHGTVSNDAVDAAFRVSGPDQNAIGAERLGAHVKHFGWLHNDYYHIDREAQGLLFTKNQYFWVRFDD